MTVETPRLDKLDKNFLINGNMKYAQRSIAAVALTGSPAYQTLDRFLLSVTGLAGTSERSTVVPNTKTEHSLLLDLTPAALGDTVVLTQRIESIFAKELIGQVISLRGDIRSDSAETLQLDIYTADVKDDFSAVTSIHSDSQSILSDSNYAEKKFENISIGSAAANGIEIRFILTDYATLAASQLHYLTNLKLNIGKFAQEFSLNGRDDVDELQRCQRYYEKSYELDVDPGTAVADSAPTFFSTASGTGTGFNGGVQILCPFKVQKRGLPTVTPYSSSGAADNVRDTNVGGDAAAISVGVSSYGARLVVTGAPADTRGFAGHFIADAEL